MQWIESPDGVCRFCFLARKKNGSAVYRNRCRRILRPIFFEKARDIDAFGDKAVDAVGSHVGREVAAEFAIDIELEHERGFTGARHILDFAFAP